MNTDKIIVYIYNKITYICNKVEQLDKGLDHKPLLKASIAPITKLLLVFSIIICVFLVLFALLGFCYLFLIIMYYAPIITIFLTLFIWYLTRVYCCYKNDSKIYLEREN